MTAEASPSSIAEGADASLPDRVYEYLREQILDAKIPAGTPLRERSLAEELNVSRMPIRVAIPRLEAAGLAVTRPRRGAVVSHITLADVEHLFEVRLALEPRIAKLAARRAGGGATLGQLQDPLPAFLKHSWRIHDAIVALAGNPLAASLLAQLSGRTERLNRISAMRETVDRELEHRLMAEAVASGNEDLAAATAAMHTERERGRVLEALPSHPHFSNQS